MKRIFIFLLFLFIVNEINSEVRVPKLISDGMVLQREKEIRIWGWADAGEKVVVKIAGNIKSTKASNDGHWMVIFDPLNAGGPYEMTIKGKNKITVKNILIGDVWLCSGQSNMELPMRRVRPKYEDEIPAANIDKIRYFKAPKKYDFNNQKSDYDYGQWVVCDTNTVLDYSAVAYFFAKEINRLYNIPIGIVDASYGGSPIESWVSEQVIIDFPHYYKEYLKFKDDELIKTIESEDNERANKWNILLWQNDQGVCIKDKKWSLPDIDIKDWKKINIPFIWDSTFLNGKNGSIWFRKTIRVENVSDISKVKLLLGRIIDADSVYINGTFVGTISYQYPPRRYEFSPKILKKGDNTIVVRVISYKGRGGFVPDKEYKLILGKDTISLEGEWYYKEGAVMEPLADRTFIAWKPCGLYNAMIAPLKDFYFKGILWYQGESNVGREKEYSLLLPRLIKEWRMLFNDNNLPFLYVQLANYLEAKDYPEESQWALLREAQTKCLNVTNTGMAVIIDIGEWNDIHPLNKKDVAHRLSLLAQKIAYSNDNIIASGPIYDNMTIKGNKVIISFKNTGIGLVAKGDGQLKNFAICGNDRKFVWANASINGDKIIVWNDSITNPIAVRYAWADNPKGANLYNSEGLPACPFRTDDW